MKNIVMRTPCVTQIYTQRMQQQIHKKRLYKIRQQRRSNLMQDQYRSAQIQSIKDNKSKSFIKKFNENNEAVSRENIILLAKLEKAQPYLNRYSKEKGNNNQFVTFINPHVKQVLLNTEKENIRISNRIRSLSSSLNASKMDQQYRKTMQIKKRVMRFELQKDKVLLKSQRYVKSSLTHNSDQKYSERGSSASKQQQKKRIVISHYKVDEINKNKIQITTDTLSKIKNKYQQNQRPNSSIDNEQIKNNGKGFFTTQPLKMNQKRKVVL